MTALFLLMIPPIALATFRALTAKRLAAVPAAAAALVVAAGATIAPAWALRTKAGHGQPLETPVGPAFALTNGRVEVLVDYQQGWSAPSQLHGETVRRLSGHGRLAVGLLQATRPRTTLAFVASSAKPTRLVIALMGKTVETVGLRSTPKHVTVDVPPGTRPAVYDLDVAPGGTMIVPVSSVHAIVAQ